MKFSQIFGYGVWGMGYGRFPHTQNCKLGFGIIEVLAAAVVLGFLIVGLNILQKGNRESVLRVRARDAANIVAQHVLDSLGSIGVNSLAADGDGLVVNRVYKYHFEGKPQLDKSPNSAGMKVEIDYTVQVELLNEAADDVRSSKDSTWFTIANRTDPNILSSNEKNTFAKGLKATVSWPFKKSTQSIEMAKVVR